MWPFHWTPSSSPQSQLHVTAATTVACRSRFHQQILHLVEHPMPWHGRSIFLSQPPGLALSSMLPLPTRDRHLSLSPAPRFHKRLPVKTSKSPQ